MFAKQEMHCIICDECKKMFVSIDGEAFFRSQEDAEKELMVEVMGSDGKIDHSLEWIVDDGKHYCPKCAEKLGLVCTGECDECKDKGTEECPLEVK